MDILNWKLAVEVYRPVILVRGPPDAKGKVQMWLMEGYVLKSDRPNIKRVEEDIQVHWDISDSNGWIDVVLSLIKLEFEAVEAQDLGHSEGLSVYVIPPGVLLVI